MTYTILLVKETRSQEKRVALIPEDVGELIALGHQVFIEHNAGSAAGFDDQAYQNKGATIRFLTSETKESYQELFAGINLVVRAKRADRKREILENQTIAKGTLLIGALDPLDKHRDHIDEFHAQGIIAYSIDQLKLANDDPMNLLSAMSKIAGKLALQDAIQKCKCAPHKIVIIGFGSVGMAALDEAIQQKIKHIWVCATNTILKDPIEKKGATFFLLNRHDELATQQSAIENIIRDAEIVITSARRANEKAPLLIPESTLNHMKKGAVIVDLALSEGGNVEGSLHDETNLLGNEVIVTNVSGYPKAKPHEASIFWSKATLQFILKLAKGEIRLDPI